MNVKSSKLGYQGSRGLSLIELMVSIVLGLILTSGIIGVYIESKRNYSAEEEMARIQENGRFSLNFIKRELTLAGFFGGDLSVDEMTPSTVGTDCAGADWALDASEPVELINDFSSGLSTINGTTLTCLTSSEIQTGTDVFSVKRTAGDFSLRNGEFNDAITAADDNQWYLKVEDYGDNKTWSYIGSSSDFPSADKTAGSKVDYWEYYTKIFYIRNYSVSAGDGVPALCVERLAGNAMTTECLIEGVEDMQIEFGIDTDGDNVPNQFKSSPTAAEIESAVVARVYLLLRSVSTVAGHTDTKTYQLGTKAVAAKNDGFIRRVFSTTAQMRNAVLPNA